MTMVDCLLVWATGEIFVQRLSTMVRKKCNNTTALLQKYNITTNWQAAETLFEWGTTG